MHSFVKWIGGENSRRLAWSWPCACEFFANKVAKVRSHTANTPAPTFTRAPSGIPRQQFRPLTIDDVINADLRLPAKSSAADHILTSMLKQTADLVEPFITELSNRSLSTGHFPAAFKKAFITPIE